MDPTDNSTISLKSQSAWLLAAKTIGFGFAFILPIIVVRILSKEEFGIYRLTFLLLINAVAILPLGLPISAYYYLSRDSGKRASAVMNIMLAHCVVGFLVFIVLFLFPGVLGSITGSSELTRLAPLIGFAVWLWLFSLFLEHVAVANKEPKTATLFIVFAQFSKTALMSGFVLWFKTVDSILYAAIIQAAIQTLILLTYLVNRFPQFWRKFDSVFFREHLRYAIPFGVAGIFFTMQVDLHYYFVSYRYGETAYAIYAVGCFQLPLVSMLAESINSVMIPKMSELQLKGDNAEMIRVTARATQKLAFAYFPLYVFLMITSETVITTLFTARYADSVPIFRVFLTILPFMVLISDPITRAYEDLGRFLIKMRAATFVVLVFGLIFGIRYFDMTEIIALVVGVRILEIIVVEIVVLRRVGMRTADFKLFANVGKTAILSIFCGIGTLLLYKYGGETLSGFSVNIVTMLLPAGKNVVLEFISGGLMLGIIFSAFAAAYIAGSYLIGTIDDSEKEHVRRLFRNKLSRSGS